METIEYVDAATGALMDGQNGNPPPRRTRHVYFGLEQIQDYRYYDSPGAFVRLKQYLWGDPDRYPEQVGMLVGEPGVELAYHFLHDALGSVVGVVSNSGVLTERYTYDPYGKMYVEGYDSASGTWNEQPTSTTGNPFGFTGHRYDAAVGLYHTLFRSYDPALGRWLQRDPIEYQGGSLSLYEYVRSNPLAFLDALGLQQGPPTPPDRATEPGRAQMWDRFGRWDNPGNNNTSPRDPGWWEAHARCIQFAKQQHNDCTLRGAFVCAIAVARLGGCLKAGQAGIATAYGVCLEVYLAACERQQRETTNWCNAKRRSLIGQGPDPGSGFWLAPFLGGPPWG